MIYPQVHGKLSSLASKGQGYMYENEQLDQFADTDAIKEFFEKVIQFYKNKEKYQFIDRGQCFKFEETMGFVSDSSQNSIATTS